MLTVDHLLPLIAPFCEARGISESRLSNLLFNDGKRIRALRERNSDIGSRGLRDAFQWLSDHWPEGAAWPENLPRPEPTARSAA